MRIVGCKWMLLLLISGLAALAEEPAKRFDPGTIPPDGGKELFSKALQRLAAHAEPPEAAKIEAYRNFLSILEIGEEYIPRKHIFYPSDFKQVRGVPVKKSEQELVAEENRREFILIAEQTAAQKHALFRSRAAITLEIEAEINEEMESALWKFAKAQKELVEECLVRREFLVHAIENHGAQILILEELDGRIRLVPDKNLSKEFYSALRIIISLYTSRRVEALINGEQSSKVYQRDQQLLEVLRRIEKEELEDGANPEASAVIARVPTAIRVIEANWKRK